MTPSDCSRLERLPGGVWKAPPLLGARHFRKRAKGLEPSTPTLARAGSTTELHPHERDGPGPLNGGLIRTLHLVEKRMPRSSIVWALGSDGNVAPRSAATSDIGRSAG